MANTIDMQDIRNLNLFSKITHVNTRFSFNYNNTIYFCVPKESLKKALGKNAENVKKISRIMGKRVKIIPSPENKEPEEIKKFINKIISPVTAKEIKVSEDEIIIDAGRESKAALIGRNKRRLNEMEQIVANYFGKGFKII
mgnify:CR=1 FL=1